MLRTASGLADLLVTADFAWKRAEGGKAPFDKLSFERHQ